MNRPPFKPALLAALISLSFNTHAAPAPASLEQKLDHLQKEMESLKQQLAEEKMIRNQQVAAVQSAVQTGKDEASATTIGGYGEVAYNNYRDNSVKDQADLKRFVLFFGHRFNEKLRFYSEMEVEHAFAKDGKAPANGELEMEQAFIEYGLAPTINMRAGLQIIPMGILNETHEPPTFYGVERPEVEQRIIPTTWREVGLGLQGRLLDSSLEYNVGVSTSMDASLYKDASKSVRDLRTSGSKAAANDLAVYGSLNYRQPGWSVGTALFTGDTAQNGNGATAKTALVGKNARLTLWDVHGTANIGDLDLRALYARGTLGDTLAINQATGLALGSNKAAPQSFWGWYGEGAYSIWKKGEMRLSPFVRYERYNTQDKVDAEYTKDLLNDETVVTAGMNFNLSRDVVLKADWQNYKRDNLKDRFNLGVGYMF